MKDDLFALYGYNTWADGCVIESLRALSPDDYTREMGGGWPSVRATFVHIAGATNAWSIRFSGQDVTALPKDAELPKLDDAVTLLGQAHERLQMFLGTLTSERIAGPFTWKNLSGQEKTAPFWAVLRHVVNHATYHRGQVSSMVKRLGGKPIATDMVLWGIEQHDKGS